MLLFLQEKVANHRSDSNLSQQLIVSGSNQSESFPSPSTPTQSTIPSSQRPSPQLATNNFQAPSPKPITPTQQQWHPTSTTNASSSYATNNNTRIARGTKRKNESASNKSSDEIGDEQFFAKMSEMNNQITDKINKDKNDEVDVCEDIHFC